MEERVSAGLRRTPEELRIFALTVGGAFAAFGAVALWRGRLVGAVVFCGLSVVLCACGMIFPMLLNPVERWWMSFAGLLSKVTTPLFMGVVYFLIFTPFGIVRRLFGANSLTSARGRDTAWVRAARSAGISGLERQF